MVTSTEHPGVTKDPTSVPPEFIGEIHHPRFPTD